MLESPHIRCWITASSILEREPSVSAANLQDTFPPKAHEMLDQPGFKALRRICR
jgi:hypothetical protein